MLQAKQRLWLTIIGMISLFALFASPTIAATTSTAKGYATNDKDLKPGMVASLVVASESDTQMVGRASSNNRDNVVGIVTTIKESSITLTTKEAQVHITENGQVMAYVSDINGEVKSGDYVEVSPLKGILQRSKGGFNDSIVGTAIKNQSEVNNETNTVQTESGKSKQAKIATIPIEVNLRRINDDSSKRSFLILFGESITGKPVNDIQVIIAFIIFFIILIVEGSIVYGAVQTSITAIGRNPLSKKSVYRQMFQVSILVIVILLVGLGAGYLVLWI